MYIRWNNQFFNAEKDVSLGNVWWLDRKNLVASHSFFRAKVIQFSAPRRKTFLAWENYSLPLLSSLSIVGESFQTKVGTVFNDVSLFFLVRYELKRKKNSVFVLAQKGRLKSAAGRFNVPHTYDCSCTFWNSEKKSVGWQVNCFADHFSSQLEQIFFLPQKILLKIPYRYFKKYFLPQKILLKISVRNFIRGKESQNCI